MRAFESEKEGFEMENRAMDYRAKPWPDGPYAIWHIALPVIMMTDKPLTVCSISFMSMHPGINNICIVVKRLMSSSVKICNTMRTLVKKYGYCVVISVWDRWMVCLCLAQGVRVFYWQTCQADHYVTGWGPWFYNFGDSFSATVSLAQFSIN